MKRIINAKRILAAVLILVSMIGIFALNICAAEPAVSGKLTIGQEFTYTNGRKPSADEVFYYELTSLGNLAADETANDLVESFSLDGNEQIEFELSYEHAGYYHYRLEPVIKTVRQNYIYDRSIYDIYARVENQEDGLALRFVIKDEDGEKVERILYKNGYSKPLQDTPHTGDSMHLVFYCALAAVSCTVILLLIFVKKKKPQAEA